LRNLCKKGKQATNSYEDDTKYIYLEMEKDEILHIPEFDFPLKSNENLFLSTIVSGYYSNKSKLVRQTIKSKKVRIEKVILTLSMSPSMINIRQMFISVHMANKMNGKKFFIESKAIEKLDHILKK